MNNKTLSFLVLFLSLLGCYKEPAFLRDPRLERTRREQGLEQLDGKFFLYRVRQWHDDQHGGAVVKRADYKRHHSENCLKSILFLSTGELITEEDIFYSGRKFHDPMEDDLMSEKLRHLYLYNRDLTGKNYFYPQDSNSLYFLTTNSTSCSGKRITMMEAESILKRWGFR